MLEYFLVVIDKDRDFQLFRNHDEVLGYLFSLPKNNLLRTLNADIIFRKLRDYEQYEVNNEKKSILITKVKIADLEKSAKKEKAVKSK